jgi:uncharacterized protein (DUF2235 family)
VNIVICCDGTGNEFGPTNSNVVKIFSVLEKNQHQQTVFYHPGLGTFGITNPFIWLKSKVRCLLGLAFGSGIRQDVADCYRFLMDNYKGPEDRIYVFGFSRGAYTARVLCAMLHEFGLLTQGNEGLIDYAYKMFNKPEAEKLELAKQFKATFSRVCKPHFLGLWDTVSSVGWIYDPTSFPYTFRNPDIRVGKHAISIDERRCFFRQNLWARQMKGQSIEQVWFAGVHSDIGGGYDYSECGLSNIALKWMVGHAMDEGLLVDPSKVKELFKSPNVPPSADGKLHRSLSGWWWVLEFFPKRYFDFKSKTYLMNATSSFTPRIARSSCTKD